MNLPTTGVIDMRMRFAIGPIALAVCLLLSLSAMGQDLAAVVRDPASASGEMKTQAVERLNAMRRQIDADDPLVITALERAETLFADGQPVRDELDRAVLVVANRHWLRQGSDDPATVTAHPMAEAWFGAIPDDAQRVTRRVTIDTATDRWHSTGLYAVPGEVVTIHVPEAMVGVGAKVRLSGHRDDIRRRDRWDRTPLAVSVTRDLDGETVQIASRFGGAVYIDLGRDADGHGRQTFTIDGVIEAPMFVLGRDTNTRWQRQLRERPAPYAELVGEKVILSVPAEWVRSIDDMAGLLRFWDRVVDRHDALGGMAHLRTSPERINVDVQISAGLYHAGYPMQGAQGQSRNLVDLPTLAAHGSWGWFHELGHEAQRRPDTAWGWDNPYTFDGSIECTVNLFTVHAMQTLGLETQGGWAWTATAEGVAERARQGIEQGGYQQVGVGHKLAMFLQVRDAFGWDPICETLTSYSTDQDEDPSRLPADEQAERDEMALRLSRATGHNLVPFLRDLWKLPISEGIEAQVGGLPAWMPEGF